MSVVGALLAGGAIGVKHALETDHLAAVATLVGDDEPRSSAAVGASWGVGHALPVVGLGLAFLALGVSVPPTLTTAVEGLVGLVLVALGIRMLLEAMPGATLSTHAHGDQQRHRHLLVARWSVGLTHSHTHGEAAVVGVLHGIAGSGALVVALVATSQTVGDALGLLAGFVACSIATMAVVALLWGRSLGTGFERPLRGIAGFVGVGVGLLLVARVAGVPLLG